MTHIFRKIIERLYYKNISLTRTLSGKGDISADQLKAARALLGWSQADLAQKSGYSLPAINNIERGLYKAHSATMEDIIQTFEQNGIQFLDGPGVRLENTNLRMKCYEGEDALHCLCRKIGAALENSNQELLVCGIDENFIQQFYTKEFVRLRRHLKNNPVRILTYKKLSSALEFDHFKKRFAGERIPLLPCFIYAGRVAMVLLGNPVHVIILYSDKLTQDYTSYFDYLWQQSK